MRKKLYSRGTFFALLLLTVLLAQGAWGVFLKHRESEKNLALVDQKLLAAEIRKNELETSIYELETPQGIEKEIRNKFSVAKEGEDVIVIISEEDNFEDVEPDNEGIMKKISRWFSGLF